MLDNELGCSERGVKVQELLRQTATVVPGFASALNKNTVAFSAYLYVDGRIAPAQTKKKVMRNVAWEMKGAVFFFQAERTEHRATSNQEH
jgi:hypothetical protein